MKISLEWINEFVDVSDYRRRPQDLADLLTGAGLEVESVEDLGRQYENVVIGQILRKAQHPDADKLTVCEVSTGAGVSHQIVCGAKNHNEEDYVVVALPGAVLPGDFKIKPSKLRGVESHGMLCSASELGLEGGSSGILLLPKEGIQVGQAFAEYQGLNDVVFELKVTPNRADCLSHYGLAREIASLLGRELKKPEANFSASGSTQSLIQLNVKNADLCPRYAGRILRGVKVGESPAWLKRRLNSVGLNSINNVVDVTNYVMMELGQPLHAFDLSKISGSQIIVENSKAGEKFQTLDETEITLTGHELMIRDKERAVALAGVVGGLNSGVDESTTDIFLESAYFLPQTVRKTSRFFGIDTDSAYRFSRGVDPSGTDFARDRACYLILQMAGGEALGEVHDFYPQPIARPEITISSQLVSDSLGYPVELSDLEGVLKNLGCQIQESNKEGSLKVCPPAFRVDLEQDMDLVEEYARVNGYDKIPESIPALNEKPKNHEPHFLLQNEARDVLIDLGYFEAQNFAFTSSQYEGQLLGSVAKLNVCGLGTGLGEPIFLKNPLSEDLNVMRSSLLPSLFRNSLNNQRHGNDYGRLFEISPVFGKKQDGYHQETRLALVSWGQRQNLWQKQNVPCVFQIKAAIEALLGRFKIKQYRWEQASITEWPDLFHPGQSAALVVEGKRLGLIGSLHPLMMEENKIRDEVAFAEIDLESLFAGQPRPYRMKPVSKFQAVDRDLALVMPKQLGAGEVIAAINKICGPLLQTVEVFDVYQGEKLPEDQKSVAFRLRLRKTESTLSDTELTELQERLISSLKEQFAVTIR